VDYFAPICSLDFRKSFIAGTAEERPSSSTRSDIGLNGTRISVYVLVVLSVSLSTRASISLFFLQITI